MWFKIWRVQENARLELGWGVAERESKGKVFIKCDDYVIWISMTRRGRRDREGQDLRRQSLGWDEKMIWNSKHPLYKVKRETLQNYISSYCPIFSDLCLWWAAGSEKVQIISYKQSISGTYSENLLIHAKDAIYYLDRHSMIAFVISGFSAFALLLEWQEFMWGSTWVWDPELQEIGRARYSVAGK